jgi:hypothetical protein
VVVNAGEAGDDVGTVGVVVALADVVGGVLVDTLIDTSTAVVVLDASSSPHATTARASSTTAADRIAPTVASRLAATRSGDAARWHSQQPGQGPVVAR